MIEMVETLASSYASAIYLRMARLALPTARLLAAFTLFAFILRIFLNPARGAEYFSEFLKEAAWILIAAALLGLGDPDFLFGFIRDPLQGTALNLGTFVIQGSGAAVATIADPNGQCVQPGSYAWIWSGLEQSLRKIFDLLVLSPEPVKTDWGGALLHEVIGFWMLLPVIAPYLFLLVYFCMQVVQVMFAFVLVSAASPVLVLFLASNATRRIPLSALKLLLTNSLSLVFSCIALGFTIQIIATFSDLLWKSTQSADLAFLGPEYLGFLFLGMLSIIMHQMAPRLAAQIGGTAGTRLSPSQHAADRVRRQILAPMIKGYTSLHIPIATGLRLAARTVAHMAGSALIAAFGEKR